MNGGSSSSSSAASSSAAAAPPPQLSNFGRSLQHRGQAASIVDQQVAAAVAAAAAAGARPPWFQTSPSAAAATPNDLALRAAGLYNMRLESLATQMLSLPNAAAAAAAASHLASLQPRFFTQAAANASANGQNLPPSVAHQGFPSSTNAGVPPPPPPTCCSVVAPPVTSSQYAHHHQQQQPPPPLLNPYLFSAAAAAAYAAQAAAANNAAAAAAAAAVGRPTAQAPPPTQMQPAPPAFLPMDSAFLPASLGLPRYRYHVPTSPLSETTPPGSTPHRSRPPGALDGAAAAAAHFRQQTPQHHPHFPMRRPSSPTAHLSPNLSIPNFANHQPDHQTYNRHLNHRASISGCSIPLVSALDFAARPPPVTAAAPPAGQAPPARRPVRPSQLPVQPYYPTHFMRGTWIRLASGNLKKVEDLNGEDFINSADLTQDLKVDISEVVRIDEKATDETVTLSFAVGEQKLKVTVEATQEHPFFVIGQGWSSYNPEKTKLLYGLNCNKLKTKDCCISLTSRDGLANHLAEAAAIGHCTNVVVSAPPAAPTNQKVSSKTKSNHKFSFQNITGAVSPIKQNNGKSGGGGAACNGHSAAALINNHVTAVGAHKRKNRNINDLAEDLSISAATHQQGISKTKKSKSEFVASKCSTSNENFQHRRSSTPILAENLAKNRKPSSGRRFSFS